MSNFFIAISGNTQNVQTERWLFVCVFVREKDRERGRQSEREREENVKTEQLKAFVNSLRHMI
jgi:hypothetical protein